VKKRTQLETKLGGATVFIKRSKASGEFMAIKKSHQGRKDGLKFKGARLKKAAKQAKKRKHRAIARYSCDCRPGGKPFGIRGRSPRSVRLQTGQAVPAAPHVQPCGPVHG
jgi:hypothetical protein